MPHLTDSDLVLHFYGEGREDQEPLVGAHLESCAECQALWREITGTLRLVDAARVPEPPDEFEERMWARVRAALPAPAPSAFETRRDRRFGRRIVTRWLVPAAALAAAVVLAVMAGRPRGTAPAPPVTAGAADPAGRERVLLTALGDHFQRSEMLLVEVMNGGIAAGEIAFEQQTADELLSSSRIYRVLAEQSGKARLADMLEELESVLVEIARSPQPVDRQHVRTLRAQIEDADLLFKVRVVSKQIQDRQQSLSTE